MYTILGYKIKVAQFKHKYNRLELPLLVSSLSEYKQSIAASLNVPLSSILLVYQTSD